MQTPFRPITARPPHTVTPARGCESVKSSLSPRYRPVSAPIAPASAAVRAGGRLYVQSPLYGMSEAEMINEARMRLAHNKQRQRLKQLLHAASNGGSVVATKDLLLACRIARLDVGTEIEDEADKFVQPENIASRDCRGTPRVVAWKGFHSSIQFPELHAPGTYSGKLPLTRLQKKQYEQYQAQLKLINPEVEDQAVAETSAAQLVSDEDVRKYHKLLKRCLETRFAEIRRAFRLIDEDNSGDCDRMELKSMLNAMFNLSIPEAVMDRIINLADYDGDGKINFAEFARVATEDDVLNMKQTLRADVSNFGRVDPQKMLAQVNAHAMVAQRRIAMMGGYEDGGYHPKLRRTGPNLDELRQAHKTLKRAISRRFTSIREAFDSIDADGSGLLRRAELRRFLQRMTNTIPDRVISGLIDFCDDDGDGKTLSIKEFSKLMSAEYLGRGKGGFDPNANRFAAANRA